MWNHRRGFTLLELVMVVGIFSLLITVAATSAFSFSKKLNIGRADVQLVDVLTNATLKARSGDGAQSWGVYLPYNEATRVADELVVFRGTSYAMRDRAFDETYPYTTSSHFDSAVLSGAGVSTGNDHEVVFTAFTGATSQYGTITLNIFGVDQTILVTPEGFITREF
ncbi:prepilin-type N-terminal cleavage/methylation domain-containing protein [Candidatus Uhrbacteria bacterium]|nr:prepilin-type N-terminal cleavage/methylation domain-containing protein [Candidatus Uhrbacteria bacterium]